MKLRLFILFLFLVTFFHAEAKEIYRDSLQKLLLGKQHDTTRAKIHNELAFSYLRDNDYLAIREAKMALEYAQKSKHFYLESRAYMMLGSAYDNTIRYSDAQKYYFKALKIAEEIPSTELLLEIYNKIGIIYSYQKNSKQAYKYFSKFLSVAEKEGKEDLLARGYNNLGISLKNEGKFEEAIQYYHKALAIFTKRDFKRGMVSCYSNIGVGWMELSNNDSSEKYYFMAEKQAYTMHDTFSMAITQINIGEWYQKKNNLSQAVKYYSNAVNLCRKKEMLQQLRDAHEGLYKCYEKNNDFKNAFIHHRRYLKLRDSIFNDETNGKLAVAEQNYVQLLEDREREKEVQRNKVERAEKDKQIALEKAKNEETKKYIWVLVLISVSVVVLTVVLYYRYSEKRKSNELLQKQKDEITHSKKEITDSINYALRIQQAVLPSPDELKNYFSDYFILYYPKDIVSGDFYWFAKRENHFFMAAADCTGHGVPGGFMSMIGTDKLNHAIFEKGEKYPGKILSAISRGVKTALKQDDSESTSKDGMDISLLSLTFNAKNESKERDMKANDTSSLLSQSDLVLQWAGANRPLWKISDGEFTEFKPTKAAIGGFTSETTVFETNKIPYKKGDVFYMFSDGFADQFGGESEKKLSTKRFREKLISVANMQMQDQKKELQKLFDEWKGNNEQIDDVLVIGVRV